MTSTPPPPAIGDTLSQRYRLEDSLGAGASSIVFRAIDATTEETVAVKVLRPEFVEDDAVRRRFRREADVLKQLSHPSIVRWLDFGTDPHGRLFMVTEFIEGATLRDSLGTVLALERVRPLLIELCDAAEAAHQVGVLHGDIKPDNVILEEDPPPLSRLVDFGTSKILGLDRLTRTGELAGTPQYMAPELLTGRGEVGPTIDVYSLGVVAYECLSGAVPFDEGHVGRLLFKIASGDVLPLDKVTDTPASVAELVARAMRVEPAERFGSAREMKAAWEAIA